MTATAFPHSRVPLDCRKAEEARTTAYWRWLEGVPAAVCGKGRHISNISDGGHWSLLETASDADFEALHMRHSIGHSWEKYSGVGYIYSLRSAYGIPQATILVKDDAVVHAREHENARLSEANMHALETLAAEMGWIVIVEGRVFDSHEDGDATATRIRYLKRYGTNEKTFATVVLDGRLNEKQINDVSRAVGNHNEFDPDIYGFERLAEGQGADHEIQSVCLVCDAPTIDMSADAFHAAALAYMESNSRLSI